MKSPDLLRGETDDINRKSAGNLKKIRVKRSTMKPRAAPSKDAIEINQQANITKVNY